MVSPMGGGGGLQGVGDYKGGVAAKFGVTKFGAEKIWHQFLYTTENFCTKFPDCGTASTDRACWPCFPMGGWCHLLGAFEWLPGGGGGLD